MVPYVKPRAFNAICAKSIRDALFAPPPIDRSPEAARQAWIDAVNKNWEDAVMQIERKLELYLGHLFEGRS